MMRCGCTSRYLVLGTAFSLLVVSSSFAQDQQGSSESNSPYHEEIRALAGRILKKADKAKCRPKSCTVLVANFTTPSGSTSRLGIQLADSVSAELQAQGGGIQTVDRKRLEDYLVREHIPSTALKDREAARWLATEFQANVVLVGKVEELGDHYNLLIELLNTSNDKDGPQEAMPIAIPEPHEAFAPFEPYDAERQKSASPAGASPTFRAGVNGTSIPMCIHCPPPLYTNAARKVKFTGTVVLNVRITEDGRPAEISVLKGVPFGLNEAAIKSVGGWSFKPATHEGKLAAVQVPIEVTFRLY